MVLTHEFVVDLVADFLGTYSAHQTLTAVCKITHKYMRKVQIHLKEDPNKHWHINQIYTMMNPKINKILNNQMNIEIDRYYKTSITQFPINAVKFRNITLNIFSDTFDVPIGNTQSLKTLTLKNGNDLTKIPAIEQYTNLETVHLKDCDHMYNLDPINYMPNITSITIEKCNITTNSIKMAIYQMSQKKLTHIIIKDCDLIEPALKKYIEDTYPDLDFTMTCDTFIIHAINWNFLSLMSGQSSLRYSR
jgi:hypothetical protein